MLVCLRVRNFAIIDELEVELGKGLNAVTGETGAGKSILIDALQLVLGGRARPEVVRTGADTAEVEALFGVSGDHDLCERLAAHGIDGNDELIVRRVIAREGKSRAYINGRLVAGSQLSELASGIANISSQHEHHTLINPSRHMFYLDAFGALSAQREAVAAEHHALAEITEQLADAERKLRDRSQREDLLRYQIKEIADVNPQADELASLTAERDRQRHAERLISVTGGAEETLYAQDDAITTVLARIVHDLAHAATWDPTLPQWADAISATQAQLEDVARDLGSYARRVTLDADQLAQAEERIDALDRLRRKYGGTIEAVIAHRTAAETELTQLEQGEEHLALLRKTLDTRRQSAMEAAKKLSAARKKAAKKLSVAVSAELATLGMGDAEILVEVEPAAEREGELSVDGARLSATGIDRVEFLIAPNRGEAPQPLRKIASGGELSRAMLAIKRVLAEHGPAAMYVFDEVDAGVGGAIAEVIGRKLAEVARHHQVLCITHLPQIAVFAETHFRVHKEVEDGRTHSRITRLKKSDQKEEIARMLGGLKITDKTRAAAAEMLKIAGQA